MENSFLMQLTLIRCPYITPMSQITTKEYPSLLLSHIPPNTVKVLILILEIVYTQILMTVIMTNLSYNGLTQYLYYSINGSSDIDL